MEFINIIKQAMPDYAGDTRLNLDGVVARSSLEGNDAAGVSLAAAFAARSKTIVDAIRDTDALAPEELNAALSAAALMGMNNIWYPYVEMAEDKDLSSQPPQLRMNAYMTSGGVDRRRFEMYALAASIVGKCHFCVKSHYELLRKEGMSAQQLRDVGRIVAVINAAAQVLNAEGPG
ncbi:MAG: carboxymuconolactone decarboxylase family protein [Gammaproteobacteria bacterium]